MKQLAPFAIISSLALVGCNPNSTSAVDGLGNVSLAFGSSQNAARTAQDVMARSATASTIDVIDSAGNVMGSIALDEAWIVVDEVELEHEDDDDSVSNSNDIDQEIEFIGPFAVDLLTGDTYPPLPTTSIDIGTYNDIEIEIERLEQEDLVGMPNLPQGIADDLINYSMYFTGNYSNSSYPQGVPFTFAYRQTDEFELSGTDFTQGFVVDDVGLNDIIVAFRLKEWFRFNNIETNTEGVDFEQAIVALGGGNFEIVLDDSSSNAAVNQVLNVIKENIEESAEYGEDDDDDGYLDDDEDDDEYDDEDDSNR